MTTYTDRQKAFESAMVAAGYHEPERSPFSTEHAHGAYKYERDQDRYVGFNLALDTSPITGEPDGGADVRGEREAREDAQRERMNVRFAARASTPETADFDLPAQSDAVVCYQCKGCGDNDAAPGHCVRCGGTGFERSAPLPEGVTFEWPPLPAFPEVIETLHGDPVFTEHQMQGYANAYGEIVRALLAAAKPVSVSAEDSDSNPMTTVPLLHYQALVRKAAETRNEAKLFSVDACNVDKYVSRMCERGTKGCTTEHSVDAGGMITDRAKRLLQSIASDRLNMRNMPVSMARNSITATLDDAADLAKDVLRAARASAGEPHAD